MVVDHHWWWERNRNSGHLAEKIVYACVSVRQCRCYCCCFCVIFYLSRMEALHKPWTERVSLYTACKRALNLFSIASISFSLSLSLSLSSLSVVSFSHSLFLTWRFSQSAQPSCKRMWWWPLTCNAVRAGLQPCHFRLSCRRKVEPPTNICTAISISTHKRISTSP